MTIGDSLTHGFQSGAIYNTDLSYPAIIARELGWGSQFRYPTYSGFGGLPLNIEWLIRELEHSFGDRIDWWELALALFRTRNFTAEVEDWWERGPGATPPHPDGPILHNLAVWGWDLRDTLSRNADICRLTMSQPKDNAGFGLVENANERSAIRVLESARNPVGNALTPLEAAQALGNDGGIETLIVLLGANNALQTVTQLKVRWSQEADYRDLKAKSQYTIWDPDHFAAEFDLLVAEVEKIDAKHVIWGTVPHVTIAPVARGVARKVREDSRYFPFYTRPWINDEDFDIAKDPRITENEARAVDSAIDQYNDHICAHVAAARAGNRDWYVLDLAGLLDRLAARRYQLSPAARPSWWTPYDLPPELTMLSPKPDSRFFCSGPDGRTQGGLFSLDGVHPTTIAYGIIAQELINIMQRADVRFFHPDGMTPRQGPVRVDFKRLLGRDTLISDPPRSVSSDLRLIGWFDERLDWLSGLVRI